MAYKFIDSQTKYAGDPSKLLIDVVIATICNSFDSQQQEDNVQLQILKVFNYYLFITTTRRCLLV